MSLNWKTPSFFVILPVFNEEFHLAATIKQLISIPQLEILLVNDFSTDSSLKIAEGFNINCINNSFSKGRDGAIFSGFTYYLTQAQKDWLITFDADGQHSIDFFKFINNDSKTETHILFFYGNPAAPCQHWFCYD